MKKPRAVIFATLGTFALVCSQPALSGELRPLIPRTKMTLERLVFRADQDTVAAVTPPNWEKRELNFTSGISIPLLSGGYTLCSDGAMTPEFRVSSIFIWTTEIFSEIAKPNNKCKFSVLSSVRYHPDRNDIRTEDCIFRIEENGSEILSLIAFVTEDTKRHYFQCEYRLSMAMIGFGGALSIPQNDLFTASDQPFSRYGYPVAIAYSRIMPEPFIHLQWACRIKPRILYRPRPGQSREQVNADFRKAGCNTYGGATNPPPEK